MSYHGLKVLEAAQLAALKLNTLIDAAPRGRIICSTQLRDAVTGIPGNIAEGLGREEGADRNYKYVVARGEADETISRLKTNFEAGRIPAKDYWPLRNLLKTIVKMLDGLIYGGH
jgi:four helix bundle protein